MTEQTKIPDMPEVSNTLIRWCDS